MCPTSSYQDAVAVGQTSSVCCAIDGRITVSARPWVTSTGIERPDRTSSPSISREISAPRTSGSTTMFQHSAGRVVGRERVGGAGRDEPPDGVDVRAEVGHACVRGVVEEPRSDVLEVPLPEHHGAADEIDAGECLLAVLADVVTDDEAAVGPRDHDRTVQLQSRRSPPPRPAPTAGDPLVLGVARPLGHAVPAQVEGDEMEVLAPAARRPARPSTARSATSRG